MSTSVTSVPFSDSSFSTFWILLFKRKQPLPSIVSVSEELSLKSEKTLMVVVSSPISTSWSLLIGVKTSCEIFSAPGPSLGRLSSEDKLLVKFSDCRAPTDSEVFCLFFQKPPLIGHAMVRALQDFSIFGFNNDDGP